jgi:FixJ family two-component response regulator
MPKKSGKELYYELKALDPKVKILLNSGHKKDSRIEAMLKNDHVNFIQKPYTYKQLTDAIYRILNETL